MIEEIEKEGLTLMHLRKVPVNSDILGRMPWQLNRISNSSS